MLVVVKIAVKIVVKIAANVNLMENAVVANVVPLVLFAVDAIVVKIVARMGDVLEADAAQNKAVAVVVKMDAVLEDVAPFAIVVASKVDAAKSLVVPKVVVLVLSFKIFY